jgi:FkbM family methyltransferase
MVVIDVGAHVGEYSLMAAKLVGASGMVHAFEPQPILAPLIAQNAARNGFTNIRIHTCAVADRTGETSFRSDPRSMGGWMAPGSDGTMHVPCTSLDQFVAQWKLPRLDLMKIDAAGNEFAALRGAPALLARHAPAIICKLYHPDVTAQRFGYDVRMVAETLWDAGYDMFVLEGITQPARVPVSSWTEIREAFSDATYCLTSLAVKR